jgi:hypothetical protein
MPTEVKLWQYCRGNTTCDKVLAQENALSCLSAT